MFEDLNVIKPDSIQEVEEECFFSQERGRLLSVATEEEWHYWLDLHILEIPTPPIKRISCLFCSAYTHHGAFIRPRPCQHCIPGSFPDEKPCIDDKQRTRSEFLFSAYNRLRAAGILS